MTEDFLEAQVSKKEKKKNEEAGRSTSDGSDARVLVVTGRGVHSKGGGPVVKPAIESE